MKVTQCLVWLLVGMQVPASSTTPAARTTLCQLSTQYPSCICRQQIGHLDLTCVDVHMSQVPILSADGAPIASDRILITGTNIAYIDAESFRSVAMTTLDMQRNNISSIHPAAFDSSSATMKRLDLSSNSLTSIPTAVSSLEVLETLVLSDNNIVYLGKGPGSEPGPLGFIRSDRLETLFLEDNPILSFDAADFPRVQKLTMSFSHSGTIVVYNQERDGPQEPGDVAPDHVPVSIIPRRIRSSLRVLIITNCSLCDVHFSTDYENLRFLGLEQAGLADADIQSFGFTHLGGPLRGLSFKHNQIKWIPRWTLIQLPLLEYLDMSHNNIRTLVFVPGLRHLKTLRLASNFIRKIHSSAFSALPSLERLDLSDNLLSVLPSDDPILNPSQMINTELSIGMNAWACNCSNQWLIRAIQQDVTEGQGPFLTSEIYRELFCMYYHEPIHMRLLDVDLDELGCDINHSH